MFKVGFKSFVHFSIRVIAITCWFREIKIYVFFVFQAQNDAVEMNGKYIFPSRKTEDETLRIDYVDLDEEDKKMLKLALKRLNEEKDELVKDIDSALYPSVPSPVKSKHVTGSARSEG